VPAIAEISVARYMNFVTQNKTIVDLLAGIWFYHTCALAALFAVLLRH
jgi:hypothetical protein